MRVCAGYLNDLHVYDPVAMGWMDFSATVSGNPPSPRIAHGFTSVGGKLYVHGGWDFYLGMALGNGNVCYDWSR